MDQSVRVDMSGIGVNASAPAPVGTALAPPNGTGIATPAIVSPPTEVPSASPTVSPVTPATSPASPVSAGLWAPVIVGNALTAVKRSRTVHPQAAFRGLMNYERRRARRTGEPSTMLLCAIEEPGVFNRRVKRLVQSLHGLIRETDHVGWYTDMYLGVILSGTDIDNAASVCAKLSQEVPLLHARDIELQSL